MKLLSLNIKNFRNYNNIKFDPCEKINIIYGNNGSGKTNLVEAIYVLLLTKSFRINNEKFLIKSSEEFFKIEGSFQKKQEIIKYKIIVDNNGKNVFINDDKIKLLSDYISNINIVLFNPDDIRIIKDSPGIRRKYLNIEMSQFDKNYLLLLNNYNKLLKQRNSYIKQLSLNYNKSFEYLDILTKELIEIGKKIFDLRKEYLDTFNNKAKEVYKKITGIDSFSIRYKSQFNKDNDKLYELYKKCINRELNLSKTLIGIHLDDFEITIDGFNIKEYGSEGQIKNAMIALKFAELEVLKEKKGEYPIFVLDDVFSEIDEEKVNNILNLLPDSVQTFVTTTDLNKLDAKLINLSSIYKIKNGMLGEDFNE